MMTILLISAILYFSDSCVSNISITLFFRGVHHINTSEVLASTSSKLCQTEATNIYLSKVTKSASTTVANILWRFGFSRNLTFMLFYPGKFPFPTDYRTQIYRTPTMNTFSGFYNIFNEHNKFRKSAVLEKMPQNTVFLGIVRNPFLRLLS